MMDVEKLKAAVADPDQAVYYHGDMSADLLRIIKEWDEMRTIGYDGDVLYHQMPKDEEIDKIVEEIEQKLDEQPRMSELITYVMDKIIPDFLKLSERTTEAVDQARIGND